MIRRPKLRDHSINRLIPNMLTIMALCAGLTGIRQALLGHWELAVLAILIAAIFDALDGRIARWRHTHSPLGRELDSLADVISFGVAPAALAFAAGLDGGWDAAILIYFVCCGVSRLARYNITADELAGANDKVAYFEGTPIPTSVVLTAVLAFAAWQDRLGDSAYGGVWAIGPWSLHPLTLLFALSGTLMISKTLRIPKL